MSGVLHNLELAGVIAFEALTTLMWLGRGIRLPPRALMIVFCVIQALVVALCTAGMVTFHTIFSVSAGMLTGTVIALFISANLSVRMMMTRRAMDLADFVARGPVMAGADGVPFEVSAQMIAVEMRWQIPRAYWAMGICHDKDGSYHAYTGTAWLKRRMPTALAVEAVPRRRFQWREVR